MWHKVMVFSSISVQKTTTTIHLNQMLTKLNIAFRIAARFPSICIQMSSKIVQLNVNIKQNQTDQKQKNKTAKQKKKKKSAKQTLVIYLSEIIQIEFVSALIAPRQLTNRLNSICVTNSLVMCRCLLTSIYVCDFKTNFCILIVMIKSVLI